MDCSRNFQFVDCSTSSAQGNEEDCLSNTIFLPQENTIDPLDIDGVQQGFSDSEDERDDEEFDNIVRSLNVNDDSGNNLIDPAHIPITYPDIPSLISKKPIKQENRSYDGYGNNLDIKFSNLTELLEKNCIKQEPIKLELIKPERIKSEPIDPDLIKSEPIVPVIKSEPIVPVIKSEPIVPFIKSEPPSQYPDSEMLVQSSSYSEEAFNNYYSYSIPSNSDSMIRTESKVDTAKIRLAEIIKKHLAKSTQSAENEEFNKDVVPQRKCKLNNVKSHNDDVKKNQNVISSRALPKSFEKIACKYCGEMRAICFMKRHQNRCRKMQPKTASIINDCSTTELEHGSITMSDRPIKSEPNSVSTKTLTTALRGDHQGSISTVYINKLKVGEKVSDEKVSCPDCYSLVLERLMPYHRKSFTCKSNQKHPPRKIKTETTMPTQHMTSPQVRLEILQFTGRTMERVSVKGSQDNRASTASQLDSRSNPHNSGGSKTQGNLAHNDLNQSRSNNNPLKEPNIVKNKNNPVENHCKREPDPNNCFTKPIKQEAFAQNTITCPIKQEPLTSEESDPTETAVLTTTINSEHGSSVTALTANESVKVEPTGAETPVVNKQDHQSTRDKKSPPILITPTIIFNNPHQKDSCKYCGAIVRQKEMNYHRKTPYCLNKRKEAEQESENDSDEVDEPDAEIPSPTMHNSTTKHTASSNVLTTTVLDGYNPNDKKPCPDCEDIVTVKLIAHHRKSRTCQAKREYLEAQRNNVNKQKTSETSETMTTSETRPNQLLQEHNINKKEPCPDCEDMVMIRSMFHHRRSWICQAKKKYLDSQKEKHKNQPKSEHDKGGASQLTTTETKPNQTQGYDPNRKEPCPDCEDMVMVRSMTHHRRSWACQAKKKYLDSQKEKLKNQRESEPDIKGEASKTMTTTETKPQPLQEYNPNRKEPCPDCEDMVMVRSMSHHRKSWTCQAKKKYLVSKQEKLKNQPVSELDTKGKEVKNIITTESRSKDREEYNPNDKKPCPDCNDIVTVKLLAHHRKSWTCKAKKQYYDAQRGSLKQTDSKSKHCSESTDNVDKTQQSSTTELSSNDIKGEDSIGSATKKSKTKCYDNVLCDKCGEFGTGMNLSSHRNSGKCNAAQKYNLSQQRAIQIEPGLKPRLCSDNDKGGTIETSNPKYLQECNPNMKKPCPDCGEVLTVRSIPRHQQSFTCKAKQDSLKKKEKNCPTRNVDSRVGSGELLKNWVCQNGFLCLSSENARSSNSSTSNKKAKHSAVESVTNSPSSQPEPTEQITTYIVKMEEEENIIDTVKMEPNVISEENLNTSPEEEFSPGSPDCSTVLSPSSETIPLDRISPICKQEQVATFSGLPLIKDGNSRQENMESGDSACSSGFESMEEPPYKKQCLLNEKQQGSLGALQSETGEKQSENVWQSSNDTLLKIIINNSPR